MRREAKGVSELAGRRVIAFMDQIDEIDEMNHMDEMNKTAFWRNQRVLVTGGDGFLYDPSRPDGQPRRCLDTSRAEREFEFSAKVSLEEGLKRTIDWYLG